MHALIPSFLMIGAMKAGTSTLHTTLHRHPEINWAREKEPGFFASYGEAYGDRRAGYTAYCELFEQREGLTGEASTTYSRYPFEAEVAGRVFSANPLTRMLYLVRNPVDRALSHYIHDVLRGRETRTIREALARVPDMKYVFPGCYDLQIRQYLSFFPLEQIHIVSSESLFRRPAETINSVCRFLKISEIGDRISLT